MTGTNIRKDLARCDDKSSGDITCKFIPPEKNLTTVFFGCKFDWKISIASIADIKEFPENPPSE